MLEIPDAGNEPLALLCAEYLNEDLENALGNLPSYYRTPIILCDLEYFSYQEIADFMDCTIGTVRSRIHRGREQLRLHLGVIRTPRQLTSAASRN